MVMVFPDQNNIVFLIFVWNFNGTDQYLRFLVNEKADPSD